MRTKFCKDCLEHRPVSEFSRNARSRDGLAFYCRKHLAERSARSREARRTKPRVYRRPPEGLVIPEAHKWCADCDGVLPLSRLRPHDPDGQRLPRLLQAVSQQARQDLQGQGRRLSGLSPEQALRDLR